MPQISTIIISLSIVDSRPVFWGPWVAIWCQRGMLHRRKGDGRLCNTFKWLIMFNKF